MKIITNNNFTTLSKLVVFITMEDGFVGKCSYLNFYMALTAIA